MKKYLLSIILCSFAGGTSTLEASGKSFYLEHELRQNGQNKQSNYSATKVGLSSWQEAFAIRGSVEVLTPQSSDNLLLDSNENKLYYDFALESQWGDFRFIPAIAQGNDARYRADSSYQVETRYTGFQKFWPFFAGVREQYETTARSVYVYGRAGSYFLLPYPGLVLNFYAQVIDFDLEYGAITSTRQGSGQLIGLNYYGSLWNSGLSAQRSCLAENYLCQGDNVDYYSEYTVKSEYLFMKSWSIGGTIGIIEQRAEFQDPSIATISTDAKYFKILLRHHL